MSAETVQKAHAIHPVAALQNEYSLWSRNPEIASLALCEELGIAYVAFSPVARGYLTDLPPLPEQMAEGDIRRGMPRFQDEAYQHNLGLLDRYKELAEQQGCSRAQLALAWLLTRGKHVIPIPGSTSVPHLEENFAAGDVQLDTKIAEELDALINQYTVRGARYQPDSMAEIDTENFS